MHLIVMDKWREHILIWMNKRAKFDLSNVNLCVPIHSIVDQAVVRKRKIWYRYQLNILRKTAEPYQLAKDLSVGLSKKFYHCSDYGY